MVHVDIPVVKTFLCCFPLRNGVKLLGWVFLVGHIFAIRQVTAYNNLMLYLHCNLIPLYEDPDTGSHICPDWLLRELLITFAADATLTVCQIITALLLLLGAYQTKPRLILQWSILQSIMLVTDIILTQLSYINEDQRINMEYFYAYYITWKSIEAYGIYICYCYYLSLTSDPSQSVC